MAEGERADDARSTSLSEIDERAVDRPPGKGASVTNADHGENDSEAETERLERSPEKTRKHKDIVIGLGLSHTTEGSPQPSMDETGERSVAPDTPGSPTIKHPDPLPWATSVIDHGGAVEKPLTAVSMMRETSSGASKLPTPPEVAGRKRKRQNGSGSAGALSSSDDAEADEPLKKRTGSVRGDQEPIKVEPNGVTGSPEAGPAPVDEAPHQQNGAVNAKSPTDRDSSPTMVRTPRKGRRKAGRFVKSSVKEVEERSAAGDVDMDVDGPREEVETHEGEVEEDAMDVDEDDGMDATAKNEESGKCHQSGDFGPDITTTTPQADNVSAQLSNGKRPLTRSAWWSINLRPSKTSKQHLYTDSFSRTARD